MGCQLTSCTPCCATPRIAIDKTTPRKIRTETVFLGQLAAYRRNDRKAGRAAIPKRRTDPQGQAKFVEDGTAKLIAGHTTGCKLPAEPMWEKNWPSGERRSREASHSF